MNRSLLFGFLSLLLFSSAASAQTTITASTTAATSSTSPGVVVFGVQNTNSFPIAITQVATYHNTINNGKFYTVWYNPTLTTGVPGITSTNNWAQLGTSSAVNLGFNGLTTILTNKYLVIPANTTYRIAVAINAGSTYYATTGSASYTSGGVNILTGNSTSSAGYAGTYPTPTTTPAYFAGSITFVTAAATNLTMLSLLQPTNGAQFCSYESTPVRAIIQNSGTVALTNFAVTAKYANLTSTIISTTYTGSLAPSAKDTVLIGTISPAPGTYTINAYTELAADTVHINDTTGFATFTMKTPVPQPVTVSDTVCPGGNAYILVQAQASTVYKWYSAQTGGILMNISNNLLFPALAQDTTLYVSALYNGCESDRTPISAIVSPPPNVSLGGDTSFCETIPLVLNAGNPGGHYLWSTGDTTQTITVTNVSGTYFVTVDRFCTSSDTVNVTIAPLPHVSGMSYIQMNNTYYFTASSVQNVTGYLWFFGDGNTSTLPNPTHTYAGVDTPCKVILVVSNTCGTDSVSRTVTTAIYDPNGLDGKISMYPNPASNELSIRCQELEIEQVYIVNTIGSVVLKQQDLRTHDLRLRTDMLPAGNYIMRISTKAGVLNKPLQIVR